MPVQSFELRQGLVDVHSVALVTLTYWIFASLEVEFLKVEHSQFLIILEHFDLRSEVRTLL